MACTVSRVDEEQLPKTRAWPSIERAAQIEAFDPHKHVTKELRGLLPYASEVGEDVKNEIAELIARVERYHAERLPDVTEHVVAA